MHRSLQNSLQGRQKHTEARPLEGPSVSETQMWPCLGGQEAGEVRGFSLQARAPRVFPVLRRLHWVAQSRALCFRLWDSRRQLPCGDWLLSRRVCLVVFLTLGHPLSENISTAHPSCLPPAGCASCT